MIASLVVTFAEEVDSGSDIIKKISTFPGVEFGESHHNWRRVPITIDSPDPNTLEETTQRLQQVPGVVFVDVVFVHFESETNFL